MVNMSAVAVEEAVPVLLAGAVKERLEEFVAGVALASMDHPVQRENAERYVRGLLQAGPRKSLEPLVGRLAGEADYQSLQQFLADSPWDPGRVIQAVVERVARSWMARRGCWMTRGSRRTASARRASSASTRARSARSVTARSVSHCTRSVSGDAAVGLGPVSARGVV